MKPVRILFLALVVSLIGTGCATVDDIVPPKVNLVNIVPTDSTAFEQRFLVDLRVSNFNDFDIPLDGLSFEMEVNGSHFATGLSNHGVIVPRLSSAVVSVTATASSLEVFRQILNVVRTGTVDYTIRGTALVGGIQQRTVPFERDGRLNLVPDPYGRDRLAPEKASLLY